jgi:hypothetical protein
MAGIHNWLGSLTASSSSTSIVYNLVRQRCVTSHLDDQTVHNPHNPHGQRQPFVSRSLLSM